jgi:type VI protein secretion system component VasK|tara:strand:- start:344 stop:574 length:231 start_codon:yes stop_codon:yes gene_type:complete
MSIAEQHNLLKKVTEKIEIDIRDKMANNFKDKMQQMKQKKVTQILTDQVQEQYSTELQQLPFSSPTLPKPINESIS